MKPTGRKIWRDGKAQNAYKDTQRANWKRRANARINKQEKAANTRAKYGASMKPAPVVVKSLDGEVVKVVDQRELTKRRK